MNKAAADDNRPAAQCGGPDKPNGLIFQWPVRVYYEDTDAGGIVYYANYLRFFERARTEWLRSCGFAHRSLADTEGIQFVVRDCHIAYLAPARLDDSLMLHLRVSKVRRASLILEQWACLQKQPEVLARAEIRLAAVRCENGRPTSLPKPLLKLLTP